MTEKTVNQTIKTLSTKLGYTQVEPNIVQPATAYFDLLGDALRRRLYVVQNSMSAGGNQDLILRPEFTICIAQDYIQNKNIQPAKLSYSGPVFRSDDEHNCTELTQSGIEIFAASDPAKADLETIEYALQVIDNLAIKDVQLQMGDYELFFTLLDALQISDVWRKKLKRLFLSHDNLDDLMAQLTKPQTQQINNERAAFLKTIEGLEVNAAQMLVENVLSFSGIDLIGGRSAGEIAEAGKDTNQATLAALSEQIAGSEIGEQGIAELAEIGALISAAGYQEDRICFDPSIVRGLGYYSGPVMEAELTFEIKDEKDNLVRFGSVGGGGRYDGLVARFKGIEVPATGISIGVSRLYAALEKLGKHKSSQIQAPVIITVMDKSERALYQQMAMDLRNVGIRAEVYLGSSGMKAQLKYADKRGAPLVIIQGDIERADDELTIKDLVVGSQASKDITDNEEWRTSQVAQLTIKTSDLVATVQDLLSKAHHQH